MYKRQFRWKMDDLMKKSAAKSTSATVQRLTSRRDLLQGKVRSIVYTKGRLWFLIGWFFYLVAGIVAPTAVTGRQAEFEGTTVTPGFKPVWLREASGRDRILATSFFYEDGKLTRRLDPLVCADGCYQRQTACNILCCLFPGNETEFYSRAGF